jgi:HPt (histidine-containing phosphotransfer) domain-containing protein
VIKREMGEGREEGPERQTACGLGAQVFNEEDLLRNLSGDRDLVRRIVTLFLDDTRAGMERLKEALDGNDAAETGRLAHRMKGTAANIRAEALSGVLADIENKASRGDLTGTGPLFEATRCEFERFRNVFREKTDRAGSDGEG